MLSCNFKICLEESLVSYQLMDEGIYASMFETLYSCTILVRCDFYVREERNMKEKWTKYEEIFTFSTYFFIFLAYPIIYLTKRNFWTPCSRLLPNRIEWTLEDAFEFCRRAIFFEKQTEKYISWAVMKLTCIGYCLLLVTYVMLYKLLWKFSIFYTPSFFQSFGH